MAIAIQRQCGCPGRQVRCDVVIFGGTAEQVPCLGSVKALIGILAEQSADHWPQ
jgi:hypothetical protein